MLFLCCVGSGFFLFSRLILWSKTRWFSFLLCLFVVCRLFFCQSCWWNDFCRHFAQEFRKYFSFFDLWCLYLLAILILVLRSWLQLVFVLDLIMLICLSLNKFLCTPLMNDTIKSEYIVFLTKHIRCIIYGTKGRRGINRALRFALQRWQ